MRRRGEENKNEMELGRDGTGGSRSSWSGLKELRLATSPFL